MPRSVHPLYLNNAIYHIENPEPVVVYFVTAYCEGFDPLVKIGVTNDIDRRMGEISKEIEKGTYPDWLELGYCELYLWCVIEGNQQLEKNLHKAYADWSAGREWFWLDDELEAELDALIDKYGNCLTCQALDMAGDKIA
jgi:hypothetical protein